MILGYNPSHYSGARMKRTLLRPAMLLVLCIPISGCIKFQEELVLLPDGSGKMVLTFATNIAMIEKAREMGTKMDGEMEKKGLGPEDLENTEGFVAFTRP